MKTKTAQVFIKVIATYSPKNNLERQMLDEIKAVDRLLLPNMQSAKHAINEAIKTATKNCPTAARCQPLKTEYYQHGKNDLHGRINEVIRFSIYDVYTLSPVLSKGVEMIIHERLQHVTIHGSTPERDDKYTDGELAEAASVYAAYAESISFTGEEIMDNVAPVNFNRSIIIPNDSVLVIDKRHRWPWDMETYKPFDRIHDLAKAGALIAAEIDRLIRLEESQNSKS